MALQSARADASELIQEAMAASKKYGAASPEARLAWEAVEDMDAADNRYVVVMAAHSFDNRRNTQLCRD